MRVICAQPRWLTAPTDWRACCMSAANWSCLMRAFTNAAALLHTALYWPASSCLNTASESRSSESADSPAACACAPIAIDATAQPISHFVRVRVERAFMSGSGEGGASRVAIEGGDRVRVSGDVRGVVDADRRQHV